MARNDINRPTMKISYNAPVALTFALLSLLALAANYFTGGWANARLFSVYQCSLADPLAWIMADLVAVPAFFLVLKKVQRKLSEAA